MKILAIDTATEACSVALLNGEARDGLFEVCPQEHSQKVLPMVDELLKKHQLKVADLDAIAFGRGPGSFTGVRIATGIVQGLALGADLPVVEVSTLAAMAQQCHDEQKAERVKAVIDARMGEVYFGDYRFIDGIATPVQDEAVLAPEDAVKKYADADNSANLSAIDSVSRAGTGWEAYAVLSESAAEDGEPVVLFPNAIFMLSIAVHEIQHGRAKTVEELAPVYLRDKVTWKKLPGRE